MKYKEAFDRMNKDCDACLRYYENVKGECAKCNRAHNTVSELCSSIDKAKEKNITNLISCLERLIDENGLYGNGKFSNDTIDCLFDTIDVLKLIN